MSEEIRCESCGRRFRAGEEGVRIVEQVRVRGPLLRRPDGSPGYLPREVRVEPRSVEICRPCGAKVAAGASLARLRGQRTLMFASLFVAVLLLIVVLTPPLLPLVMSALWLR